MHTVYCTEMFSYRLRHKLRWNVCVVITVSAWMSCEGGGDCHVRNSFTCNILQSKYTIIHELKIVQYFLRCGFE